MAKFKKAVTFSYDDGVEQDRRLVELFNRYGLKGTFNLNTGIQTPESSFDIDGVHISRMPQEGLKELYQGHEIAVHGLRHLSPEELHSDRERDQEFLEDAENITRLYGTKPSGMAYAYGYYDDATVEYLKKNGFGYGRTVGVTHCFAMPEDLMRLKATCHHNDERLFELAEDFLRAEGSEENPLLFYVWGHSYEFDVNRNWDRMERFCRMIGGRDDIFYGTNRECLLLF
ncbi:MAG: polysaccharide deacetylase family protein [Clostridiaceae bacterium]|nr:polysaccharide deacetylase family protein [Clostridiaceae bacterium]